MKKTERKKRRAYLDDFTRDPSGEYRYGGDVFTLDENAGLSRKGFITRIALSLAAAVGAAAGQGLIPAPGMDNSPIVLIPYALSLVALLVLLWAEAGILTAEYPMRKYKFDRHVRTLPVRAIVFASFEAAIIVGMTVHIAIYGVGGKILPAVFFYFFCVLGAVAALLAGHTAKTSSWVPVGKKSLVD
ncbi:MAG: hypothetical protein IJK58_02205 [Clostridia bacterium]|nr:hypothetical protein [Clostridia bacterium]